jgi:hypothetical protein
LQRPLHEHIIFLEQRIQELRDQLTVSDPGGEELVRIRAQIQTAELSLAHFRAAYDLEQKLRSYDL